ncbi:ribosomal protein L1p/L10e family-domain-containing protein [Favolaschia claudopus]|uniref:Ribosomal protein L1p/L10e family-domain-containing protein n=1 Tax=Favolaschia claudopus TaxID=2862362 RepID=A0AAW0BU04_9AGAR
MADLIDGHVSLKQCKLAIQALNTHTTKATEKQKETELLPGKEQTIWLNVTVKKIASAHKFKPVKIPIVHPLVDPRTSAVCLITKDPQRQYKDLLTANNIKFISRVVDISKLKGKFKAYEARRMLLKENGLFLADERVIPLLPRLLGVKWFEAKKQPIPVCLTRKDLKSELERAISSTYMNQNQGTCTAIKISPTSHTPSQVLDNIKSALPAIVKNIKGEWDNVQSILLKTNTSAGLPIWSCDLGAERFMAVDEDEGSEMEGVIEEEEKTAKKGKGKKRAAVVEEEEEVPEEPKKKAKGANGNAVPPKAKAKTAAGPPPTPDSFTKNKKRKGADADADPVAPPSPAPASSKKYKSKPSPAVEPAAPTPTAESPVAPPKSKKKKAPDTEVEQPAVAPDTPAPKTKKEKAKAAGVDVPAPASPDKAKDGKTTKTKAKPEVTFSKAAALSSDELKQKRAGKPGEKKKEKIVKSILKVGGSKKSAKDGVIGKKKGV